MRPVLEEESVKKPTEAIERMRKAAETEWPITFDGIEDILAYLDSIPEGAVPVVWPDELTRERLEELALSHTLIVSRSEALRALAAIAPKREKRKVALWKNDCGDLKAIAPDAMTPANGFNGRWTLVGEGEIEE